VPYNATLACWCANAAGTFTNTSLDCVSAPCPFPGRCVDASPLARRNGTVCSRGAGGAACTVCSLRYYRYRDECRACPTGVPVSVILLAIGLCVFVLIVGPALSQLASPAAVALLRSLLTYLQYLSLSLDIRLAWPPALLRAFAWLRALTNGIDLAAPECVSTKWSYSLYVQLLLGSLACMFALAALAHEALRAWLRLVRLRDPAAGEEQAAEKAAAAAPASRWARWARLRAWAAGADGNDARTARITALWERCNGLKSFAAFSMSFAYGASCARMHASITFHV
jgi:hypothetical protein